MHLNADPLRRNAWRRTTNLLAVRTDNLGDVVMTTPALAALTRDRPRRVTLLTSRAGAAAFGHVPALADVITCKASWSQADDPASSAAGAAADRQLLETLVQRRFDAAIVFSVCTQSALPAALLCRLAGIPLRLAHSRENPYALLTDWVPEPDRIHGATPVRHEVRRQLDLVASVGFEAGGDERLVFLPRRADLDAARRQIVAAGGLPRQPYAVVHPGCSAASRRWPAARFGHAARLLAERSGLQIVFAGGPDESALCDEAARAMGAPSVSLAGRLGIGELAALIGDARLVVCNNSAAAHLAAAAGTPSVVLYALTNPQHTPWQVRCRVLNCDVPCRGCLKSVCPEGHHVCLLGIEPDAVAASAMHLLHETRRATHRPTPSVMA